MTAAEGVKQFVQLYHQEFDGLWRGDHYMSGVKSGQFEESVATSWLDPVLIDTNTASVVNTNPILAHKITGGPITPKNSTYLTIPLVPEAKGFLAREYEEATGNTLFFAKTHGPGGGGVLARNRLERGTFNLVPIYALVTSVDQAPWPGAMPPQEEIQAIFESAFISNLDSAIGADNL